MSYIYVVEIESEPLTSIEIESGSIADIPNIYLEVVNTEKILVSDLPPVSFTGTITTSQITDLDVYLSNFIDNYEIDCGTP
jgi:hypothetical protein